MEQRIRFAASSERLRGIAQIEKMKEPERKAFVPLLRRIVTDDSDNIVREKAARMLGTLKVAPAGETLARVLADNAEDVRSAAAWALGRVGYAGAGLALDRELRKTKFKKKDRFLTTVIQALARIKYRGSAAFLIEKLKDDDTDREIRQEIILYLGRAGTLEATDVLIKIAEDDEEDPLTRSFAVNSLGKMEAKSTLARLQTLFKDIHALKNHREKTKLSRLRLQLLTALIRLGDSSVEHWIYAAARDDDPNVRARAVRQLGQIRMKKARELLCYKYKYDSSRTVRKAARKAINRIDGREEESEGADR